MAIAERPTHQELHPHAKKAIWLFENGNPQEPIRQYVRNTLTAFCLTLGLDTTVRPKRLMEEAKAILSEVIDISFENSQADPKFVIAAQYALRGERSMTDIAIDKAEGKFVRGIQAMARFVDLRDAEFVEVPQGPKNKYFIDGALLTLAHEIIERRKQLMSQVEPGGMEELAEAPAEQVSAGPSPIMSIGIKPMIDESPPEKVSQPPKEGVIFEKSPFAMEVSTDRFKALFNSGRDYRDLLTKMREPLKEVDEIIIPNPAKKDSQPKIQTTASKTRRRPVKDALKWGEEIEGLTDEDKKRLGTNIRRLREANGLSQMEMFDDLSQTRQSRIERGVFPISMRIIEIQASKLGVTTDKILNGVVPLTKHPLPSLRVISEGQDYSFRTALDLRDTGLRKMSTQKRGELFLLTDGKDEYSLVQDGYIRVRSKGKIKTTLKIEDALSVVGYDKLMTALQRAVNSLK